MRGQIIDATIHGDWAMCVYYVVSIINVLYRFAVVQTQPVFWADQTANNIYELGKLWGDNYMELIILYWEEGH